ncbi:heme-binding protein [Kineosporia sp. A_224]|jgi:glc operon protein GlcG|uniref:GlcG/HbpS family heme-binding protein n=1 Tax=Kineosporia sp. A_224 TaxID=1962180 RepID=UPI000B4AE982|nr:heme-binding protein [Kineosporia sp. A_224]MBI4943864.1 heme-binding protein [Actinomycetota bacterium]
MATTRSVESVTFATARAALDGAARAAEELGIAVCISVADASGNQVAFGRMDGAPLLSAGIATNKAYTVSAFNGLATHEFFGLIENEPALLHGIVHTDRLVVFAGGVPIRVEGRFVGAVGCSGGSADQDRAVAEAGAAAAASA